MGAEAGVAVPQLAEILCQDEQGQTRNEAALALSKMAPASADAMSALTEALADKDGFVRMNVAIALSRLRDKSRPAIPELIKAVNNKENQTNLRAFTHTIQDMAALALGRASAGTTDGVPALLEGLEGAKTVSTRQAFARALGEVGPEARAARPKLQALLQDADPDVREAARESLRKIDGKPVEAKRAP
jgi:HEAT repeat protein